MRPLLSIIIATKNRIPYCINVIETILKFDNSDFELVIQDNSDTLDLKIFIQDNISDKRLIYNYIAPPFSSIANFNAALESANGDYVCLIGDDDGINPEIFKVVQWASLNNINAIVPELNAVYWWPDTCSILKKCTEGHGILEISKISGNVSQFQTNNEVVTLMKNGGQGYLNHNLPKLYHGVVKKEVLDKIKKITGYYIGGLSPDIYISVALTFFINKIIKIDYPLTIPGICSLSTSADSATGKHTGKLENAPHFIDRGQYNWSEKVPKIYCVEAIWADSVIASLTDMERLTLLSKFNITTLTILLLKSHKTYYQVILKNYIDNKSSNPLTKVYYFISILINYFGYTFVNILFRAVRKTKRIITRLISNSKFESNNLTGLNNVDNISQATDELAQYLSNRSFSIDIIIKKLDILLDKTVRN